MVQVPGHIQMKPFLPRQPGLPASEIRHPHQQDTPGPKDALGLPQHLAAYKLSDADLREAVRPVASAENPEADLLGILRAAL